ncbi:MAG: hypothetical protein ACREP9_09760 [Candidatus Dormibacteraceae bacterium]
MKIVGILLLLAGWGIVLAAVVLLKHGVAQIAFVLAGMGVEVLGLVFFIRSHAVVQQERG